MSLSKPATPEEAADRALYLIEGLCLGVSKCGITAAAGERMQAHTRELAALLFNLRLSARGAARGARVPDAILCHDVTRDESGSPRVLSRTQ